MKHAMVYLGKELEKQIIRLGLDPGQYVNELVERDLDRRRNLAAKRYERKAKQEKGKSNSKPA